MMHIETDRLLIVRQRRRDPRLVEWLNDKELMRWSEQRYQEHTVDGQAKFLLMAEAEGNPLCFSIMTKTSSLPVGSLHAHLDRRHRRADLGILIGPPYQRMGYAREAWREVELWLRREHNIHKFEAGVVDVNMPMQRLLQRLEYAEEGRRWDHFQIDGHTHDLVLYGKWIA